MGNSSLGWGGGGKPPEMGGSPVPLPRLLSFIADVQVWLTSSEIFTVLSNFLAEQ